MINTILQKYDGQSNYWFPDLKDVNVYINRNNKLDVACVNAENDLTAKYKKYIPVGWYGFDLGSPVPLDWFKIIDEFLTYLVELEQLNKIKNFEIHQIKLKFCGLRFDEKLIY